MFVFVPKRGLRINFPSVYLLLQQKKQAKYVVEYGRFRQSQRRGVHLRYDARNGEHDVTASFG
jgi:hypothetical protein